MFEVFYGLVACIKDFTSTDTADAFECYDGEEFAFDAFRHPFNQFSAQCGYVFVFGYDWCELFDAV